MAQFEKLTAPTKGTPIRFENGQPVVADKPIIPFIRGDGTGADIWPATQKVLDAAVAKAYGGIQHLLGGRPNVHAGAIAADEGNDRVVGYHGLAVLEADWRALSGGGELLELGHRWGVPHGDVVLGRAYDSGGDP